MDFSENAILADQIVDSDFILFPFAWDSKMSKQYERENQQVDLLSRKYDMPVVCHGFTKDVLDPKSVSLPFRNGHYLSYSLVRSRRPPRSIGFSYFIPDCREKYYPKSTALPKRTKPSVGFCGVAAPFGTPRGKTHVFDQLRLCLSYLTVLGIDPDCAAQLLGTNTKHAYRARLIRQFRCHPDITCDFSLRSVGGLVDNAYTNKADDDPYNVDYYKNLEQNLYTICCRGTENYSVRFYETLCMGRIPIVVDSDLVLPFDDMIDYRQQCVWISKRSIGKSAAILLAFHRSRSEDELIALQKKNRMLWERHLSHRGYYPTLRRCFQRRGML
jgi:hypothetical protein